MFLWNMTKRRSDKSRKKRDRESSNREFDVRSVRDNFIIRAKLPPEFTRGKQLFRKQVPIVTLRGVNSSHQSTTEVGEESSKLSLLTLEKKVKNPRNCPLCKQNLTTWFSQCVSCTECDRRTCRSCADYNQVVGEWTCHSCIHLRNNREAGWDGVSRSSSKFWYDDISSNVSLALHCVPEDSHIDRTAALRYEQLEEFVSQYLSISVQELNITDVGKVFKDSKYDLLFARYHDVISLELELVLRTSADKVQESTSLRKLKELIDKVKIAAKLDLETNMEPNPRRKFPGGTKPYEPTYPDILSTAILNRIITDSQIKQTNYSISPVSSDSAVIVDYSSAFTDLPESGSDRGTRNWVMSSTTEETTVMKTSDDESMTDVHVTDSLGSSWSAENITTPQASLKIEESIEEITTQTYESSSGDDEATSEDSDQDRDYSDQLSPKSQIQQNLANWEHNWLFARRKELLTKRKKLLQEPVSMLVPNPTGEVDVMIGDAKVGDLEDDLDSLDVSQLGYVVVNSNDTRSSESDADVVEPVAKTPMAPESVVSASATAVTITAAAVFAAEEVPKAPVPTPRSTGAVSVSAANVVIPDTAAAVGSSETLKLEYHMPLSEALHQPEPEASTVWSEPTRNEPTPELDRKEADTRDETSSDSEVEQPKLPMKIAEREKAKWNHPVSIKNNPYAAENLNKRLKEKEFITLQTTSIEEPACEIENVVDFPADPRNMDKFRRDYYIHKGNDSRDRKSSTSSSSDGDFNRLKQDATTNTVPVKSVELGPGPVPEGTAAVVSSRTNAHISGIPESDLEEIKLPSVRSLAKKFSNPTMEPQTLMTKETKPSSWKPMPGGMNSTVKQQQLVEVNLIDVDVKSNPKPNLGTKLDQVVETRHGAEASIQNIVQTSMDNLISFDDGVSDDTSRQSIQSLSSLLSEEDLTSISAEAPASWNPAPTRQLHSPSLYAQFSRSQSEPPAGSSAHAAGSDGETSWKSTRQLIMELEKKGQTASSSVPAPLKRTQSANVKPTRAGAIEELSHQPVVISTQELASDIELKKLKRSIVRGARTRKGLSLDKAPPELWRQIAVDKGAETAELIQDCEYTV